MHKTLMTNPLLSCPGSESPSLCHISMYTTTRHTRTSLSGVGGQKKDNIITLETVYYRCSHFGLSLGLLVCYSGQSIYRWTCGRRDVLVYNSTERDHRHLPWMGQCVLYFNNKDVILSEKLHPVMLH